MCFINEASGEYIGREVWQKLHRGTGIHRVGGYEAPKSVCDATASWVLSYAPKGGSPRKQTERGAEVVVIESDAPPTPKGKAPTPSPKPSKVAKVAAQPPPSPRPLMWGPWPPLCDPRDGRLPNFEVEQAAVTQVEAALAGGGRPSRGRPCRGPRRSRATLSVSWTGPSTWPTRGGGGLETVRGAVKGAEEGRQKAEVEAAGLRVWVEALRRWGEYLQQRLGVAEAQVRTLTSTPSATYTAKQELGPLGVPSQGSGSRSGSQ